MKILDRYILKSFLVPFFATFLIILFVLVMQALWMAFESIAGKGIGLFFIFKFLYYTALVVSSQALPIAVLLSSIMSLGNMSENYEFAAAKSASISLMRLMRPLIILTLLISVLNFLSLNYVFPYATLKQKNLTNNIKKKTPALALISGSFNSEIPNYQIKFDEKYGEEQNLLRKVLIYDLSSKKGNKKIITAERGKIISEEGSKYMTLVLFDGFYHEEHIPKRRNINTMKKMPASNATFKEYTFNIDISKFTDDDLEEEKYTKSYNMLSLGQLKDTIPTMKISYDEYLTSKSNSIYVKVYANELYQQNDSVDTNILNPIIWDNISWRYGVDQEYRGAWENTYPYTQGSIVLKDNKFYTAQTNIAGGTAWNTNLWLENAQKIDYLGYLPNLSTAYYGESTFDPATNIIQFSESFDVSENGEVLVVTATVESTDIEKLLPWIKWAYLTNLNV